MIFLFSGDMMPKRCFRQGSDAFPFDEPMIGDIKADFNTVDEYQASYLLSQATNELCPALIWQLRNSAAH